MEKAFDRIIIVMFENQYRNYVLKDAYMRKLAKAGANMNYFFGAFHPSQTNYIASLAGEVCAVTNDTPPAAPLMQQNLVDLMEAKGISWKAYMEAYPGEVWKPEWQSPDYPANLQPINEYPDDGKNLARYFRKHNAFASFHTTQANQNRWQKIVDDAQFWKDVHDNTLSHYSWFTPDIWNDGHYLYNTHIDTNPRTQLIPQISGWLEYVFFADIDTSKVQGGSQTGLEKLGLNLDIDLLIENPEQAWANSNVPEGTLIVVTFDEADYDAIGYDTSYEGSNQIYTVLLGDMIKPGTVINTPFNHYSLIKTIEKNYQLGTLGKNDRDANWFRFMWEESFQWQAPESTGLSGGKSLALASLREDFYLAYLNKKDNILISEFKNAHWSKGKETELKSKGPIAMAALDGQLHLVYVGKNGKLNTAKANKKLNWSKPQELGPHTEGSIALTAYHDEADNTQKIMLCWQGEQGFIHYLVYANGKWQNTPGKVDQLTDGPMAIAQFGPSLFLVYKERNTRKMRMTTYNLAPYNAFDAQTFDDKPAPQNSTSLHQWSPADMPVGNFAKKLNALQNDYRSIGQFAMASMEGELHLMHRGAYDDTPSAFTESFGLTGIFTADDPMTNGYGTIDQAGWTPEQELPDIQLDPDSPIAMASDGQQILAVWQQAGSKQLKYKSGIISVHNETPRSANADRNE